MKVHVSHVLIDLQSNEIIAALINSTLIKFVRPIFLDARAEEIPLKTRQTEWQEFVEIPAHPLEEDIHALAAKLSCTVQKNINENGKQIFKDYLVEEN